jgi:hypothetical protein
MFIATSAQANVFAIGAEPVSGIAEQAKAVALLQS